jgi:hypothetical protein
LVLFFITLGKMKNALVKRKKKVPPALTGGNFLGLLFCSLFTIRAEPESVFGVRV